MMAEESTVIQGLDDFQSVDISDAKGEEPAELDFHLMPTKDTFAPPHSSSTAATDNFTSSTTAATTAPVPPALLDTGSLGFIESSSTKEENISGQVRNRGRTASYLEGKGFGWLLELEDEEEETRPLL